jgi:hypothetical protein
MVIPQEFVNGAQMDFILPYYVRFHKDTNICNVTGYYSFLSWLLYESALEVGKAP